MTWRCPGDRIAEVGRTSLVRNRRSEHQGVGLSHPTRPNRLGGNTQDEPDQDIDASDREEEETRDEGELWDVVREDCSPD